MRVTEPTEQRPTVYLIAGSNGAGKTRTQNVRAGRLQLIRIRELASAGEDFGFETTLAGRTYVSRLRKLRAEGYRTVLFLLWLPTTEMAIERVASRVRKGGHSVPEADIRRRYRNGLRNLFRDFLPIADSWWVYDASCLPPVLLANQHQGKMVVHDESRFDELKRQASGQDDAARQ